MTTAITGGRCECVCYHQTGGIPQVSPGPGSSSPMGMVMPQRVVYYLDQTNPLLHISLPRHVSRPKGHLGLRDGQSRTSNARAFITIASFL